MSAHDHADAATATPMAAAAHGSCKGYLTGFVLSVVLTAIPFWLVMSGALDNKQATAIVIMAFARCRSSSTWSSSCI